MRRSPSTSCPCYSSQVRNGQLSQHRVALESLEVACPMSRCPTSFSTQHLFFPFVQLSSPVRCCPFEKECVFTCLIITIKKTLINVTWTAGMKFMAWIRAVFKCNRLYWLEAFEDVDVDEKVGGRWNNYSISRESEHRERARGNEGIGEHLGTFGGHLRDKWSHHLGAV